MRNKLTKWVEVSLAEITSELLTGKRPKGGVRGITEGVRSIGGEHLQYDGKLSMENMRYVPNDFAGRLKKCLVKNCDILIVKDGATTGKVALASIEFENSVINEHVFLLRPKDGIEQKFLFYFLWSKEGTSRILKDFRGTAQGGITQNFIEICSVPIAPLNEQKRIVDKIETLFSDLDKGEENLRAAQRLLSSYRQAVLKAAVTGELTRDWRKASKTKLESGEALLKRILKARREQWQGRGKYVEPAAPDTTNLPPLPDGWVWATLEQVGFVESGQTPKDVETYAIADAEYPWFKVSSMNEDGNEEHLKKSNWHFDSEGIKKAKLKVLPEGTICFPKRGGAILTNKKRKLASPAALDLNLMGYVPIMLKEYLWVYFCGLDLRKIYDGSNVPQINYHDVADLRIAIPSQQEAEEIADRARDTLSRISALEAWCETELRRSKKLRQSILKSAFSGQLVPQDETDEPASKLLERIREQEATENSKSKAAPKRNKSRKEAA